MNNLQLSTINSQLSIMNELHLQDKFLIPFFRDGLGYQEVKANTVTQSLIIEEDLQAFISDTELNKKNYATLLKKYRGDENKLLKELIELIQELPYKYQYQGEQTFSFRPDIVLFVNGIYLGYSELKSNYTNQSASKNGRGKVIKDGFILNPLKNIVPVASKMLFDLPSNNLEGFSEKEYKDAQKKQVYENRNRIDAVAEYVADLLVKDVYRHIRGTGKAMLAVYSIKAAIAYKSAVTKYFNKLVEDPKYAKYAEAPIHVVYSSNQDEQSSSGLNEGLTEEKVLDTLLGLLKQSDSYDKFFTVFMNIYKDKVRREDPESYLDFESSLKKYIDANPKRTANTKAKAARNEQEAKVGTLIEEFEAKIISFFDYVKGSKEGERLIVKIRSHVSEDEIYDDFAILIRDSNE